jgi:hypothetical protein
MKEYSLDTIPVLSLELIESLEACGIKEVSLSTLISKLPLEDQKTLLKRKYERDLSNLNNP